MVYKSPFLEAKWSEKSKIPKKFLKFQQFCIKWKNERIGQGFYHYMLQPGIYEIVYGKLRSKPGNLTILDGLSNNWILKTISKLKNESFQFSSCKRTFLPKKNGRKRRLIIANFVDKLVKGGHAYGI
jgi:hypothetical protein